MAAALPVISAVTAAAGTAAQISAASKVTPGGALDSSGRTSGKVPGGDPIGAMAGQAPQSVANGTYQNNASMYVPNQPIKTPDLLGTLQQIGGGKY